MSAAFADLPPLPCPAAEALRGELRGFLAGALVEQEIPEIARSLIAAEPDTAATRDFAAVPGYTILHAPSFSLRGGTREILRGIVARGLGLR